MADDHFVIAIEGLEILNQLDEIAPKIRTAARIAINDAATKGRTLMARGVLDEVALPRSYVQPGGKRLYVKNKASNTNLEAIISARKRRTSLTRFMPGGVSAGGAAKAKSLMVKVGARRPLAEFEGAFLFKLRGGSPDTDTKGNYGFAVRTKNGKPPKAYRPTQIGKNLWLLYGPSVSQILHSERNKGGLATSLSPKILDSLETEFFRQMELRRGN